jgi:hypothetical protein
MARKNSTDDANVAPAGKQKKPKKSRWYHQVLQVYKLTVENDPKSRWAIWGAALGVFALFVIIGLFFQSVGMVIYLGVIGLAFGVLAGMFVLARKAEKIQYGLIEGEPGASRAALGTLRRGWTIPEEPVAFDAKTQSYMFRAVGRAGVILVTEGQPKATEKLATSEQKRLNRILSGVPVHIIHVGNGEGQVPLAKVTRAVNKFKGKLNRVELAEVNKRLNALGQMKLPIPKGIDPMRARPDRRGMR